MNEEDPRKGTKTKMSQRPWGDNHGRSSGRTFEPAFTCRQI
ncbi:MAG: hypothetical protein ACYSWZ_16180 [Planctomycetota bacterium]